MSDSVDDPNLMLGERHKEAAAEIIKKKHMHMSSRNTNTMQDEEEQDPLYKSCGFSSNENFHNWYDTVITASPVIFPRSEEELSEIFKRVAANGCRIRVRGAGHSDNGVVMQKGDEGDGNGDIITINLKDFTPHQDWDGLLVNNTFGPSIKISAGASMTELISIARPEGFLLTTNTAGALFSVGGLYLNPSTIGQTYAASRCAAQVVGVRVLVGDGTYQEYDSTDPELIDFRGSMGLLGLVTALDIRLRQDTGLQMNRNSLSIGGYFNDTQIKEFLTSKLTDNDGTHFFYHIHDDLVESFELRYNGDPSFDARTTSVHYQERLEKHPHLAYTGGGRTDFGRGLEIISDLVGASLEMAAGIGQLSRRDAADQFDASIDTFRDGFWLSPDEVPLHAELFMAVKCAPTSIESPICLDEILMLLKKSRQFLFDILGDDKSNWYPHLPLDWRLFQVEENEMTLEHLVPGTYVGFEFHSLHSDTDPTYTTYFTLLEEMWRMEFPEGQIHHGKQYGYAAVNTIHEVDEMVYHPFQNDAILDSVYSDQVKATFLEKMATYDPQGIFRAGAALRMLGISNIKYEPYNGLTEEYVSLAGANVLYWLLVVELAVFTLSLVLFILTTSWFRLTRRVINKPSQQQPMNNLTLHDASSRRLFATSFVQLQHTGLAQGVFNRTDWHSHRPKTVRIREAKLSFPMLAMRNLDFSWKRGGENVIKEDSCFWLGGCKLTAIQGPSGSGKSTFLHLLSGRCQSHMTLSVGKFVSRPQVFMCQQSADIWPEEMSVQDILFFACTMVGQSRATM